MNELPASSRPWDGIAAGWLDPLPPLPPQVLWARRSSLPFPFDDARCRVCDLGRNALWLGLKALGLEEGDELLMPAYHCGTEVGPATDLGIVPRFWSGTKRLEPDEEELEGLIGPRTRGLYLIHHLGFAQDAPRWSRWCEARNLLLLEDVAPSWLGAFAGRPLGSWGSLSIFSPWKTVGLPEGAAVLCDPPPSALPLRSDPPLKPLLKGFARWPAQRSSLGVRVHHRRRRAPVATAPVLGAREPRRGISKASLSLLRRLSDQGIAEARRNNYEWLRRRIGDRIAQPFDGPPEEGCPLGVPIRCRDKKGLLDHLSSRGIGGVDFWPAAHPATPVGAFPAIEHRRATTVLLPVHQGLRLRDLMRLARAIGEWPADQ